MEYSIDGRMGNNNLSVGNELALPFHGRASNSISPSIFIRLFEILPMLNLFNVNNLRPGVRSRSYV
jgi:hypothetical protein